MVVKSKKSLCCNAFSLCVHILPWHTNSILIIVENSNLCLLLPGYSVFDLKSETFQTARILVLVASDGISWHIFPTNGSKKSSKIKNFFNFTTRYFYRLLRFFLCFQTLTFCFCVLGGVAFCCTTRKIKPFWPIWGPFPFGRTPAESAAVPSRHHRDPDGCRCPWSH